MYQQNTNVPTSLIYVKNASTYRMPNPMMAEQGKQFLLSLNELSFTNTMLNVKQATITFNRGGLFTVSIPDGNYNAINFRDKLNFLLHASGITCVFDFRNLRYSFVSSQAFTLTSCTCSRVIGANDMPMTSTRPYHTITMPNPVNFIASSVINLFIGDFNIHSLNSVGLNTRCFARIPLTVPFGHTMVYRPMEVIKFILQRRVFTEFVIRFTNEDGVDLNLTYHMQLSVQQVKSQPDDEADLNSIPWFYKTVLKLPYGDDNFDESEPSN